MSRANKTVIAVIAEEKLGEYYIDEYGGGHLYLHIVWR